MTSPALEEGCKISWRMEEARKTLEGSGVEEAGLPGGDSGT